MSHLGCVEVVNVEVRTLARLAFGMNPRSEGGEWEKRKKKREKRGEGLNLNLLHDSATGSVFGGGGGKNFCQQAFCQR